MSGLPSAFFGAGPEGGHAGRFAAPGAAGAGADWAERGDWKTRARQAIAGRETATANREQSLWDERGHFGITVEPF